MQSYYLGIDVSKGYADFIILDSDKKAVENSFQMDDTFDGHCRLYERLNLFFVNHPDSEIFSAVESTGGYENNWFDFLVKCGTSLNIRIARLNPVGVNANSKADMKRNTTDRISARNVAEYLISHPEKVLFQPKDPLAPLRKQWTFLQMLTKQSTQLLNQLETLLYCANPELLHYCKDGTPEWALKLLVKYPTAVSLAKANAKSVSKIPYITPERAKELISNSKKSVASSTDSVTSQLISATASQILHLKGTIKAQTEIMIKNCALPETDLLKSFIGIGDYSAVGLLLEIYPVERFSDVKKLASFFGIHPVLKISGDGSAKPRMSKQGRKEVRHILFMVTLNALSKNPLIKSIYEERLQKGMSKMAAIGYCMHKILRIIYGMLKHKTSFDPETDRKNREKKAPNSSKKPYADKTRRYQDYDPKAPVSGRQSKARKERKESQSEPVAENGIITPAPVPA